MKTITVRCGSMRRTQTVPVSHVAQIDSYLMSVEFVLLTLKPKYCVQEPYGRPGEWHGTVIADRADVAPLLRFARQTGG